MRSTSYDTLIYAYTPDQKQELERGAAFQHGTYPCGQLPICLQGPLFAVGDQHDLD